MRCVFLPRTSPRQVAFATILGGSAPRPIYIAVRNSIPLGSLFGIKIWLSRNLLWLAGAIFFWVALSGGPVALVALGFVLVMGLVLLHELGHSLTARRFGIRVSHITLWPLGGVAWMEEIPQESRIEGLVAVAGPAVNLVLAAITAPLLLTPVGAYAAWFIVVNLLLGGFNLLPAFPMDGGRVLRAWLARDGDWMVATEKAVSVARYVCLAMAVVGLWFGQIIVPFLAVYIWWMGQRELFSMRLKSMGTSSPFSAFQGAANPAPDPFPGVGSAGSDDSAADPQAETVRNETHHARPAKGRGFSEEDIEQLEGFRGRLQRDWREAD